MPIVNVDIFGQVVKALVDTGCSKTIVSRTVVDRVEGEGSVVRFDGSEVQCKGSAGVSLVVSNVRVDLVVLVVDRLVDGVDMILGMDVIEKLDGVFVGKVKIVFGSYNVC